jgi:hypothetical protein
MARSCLLEEGSNCLELPWTVTWWVLARDASADGVSLQFLPMSEGASYTNGFSGISVDVLSQQVR